MEIFLWILSLLGAFSIMEFMAWFTHKYIMHGFLWYLHEDHHKKDHDSWFERNDTFFLFYAVVSMLFVLSWAKLGFFFGLPIAIGIFLYGLTYFIVHDIFIHQRFTYLMSSNIKLSSEKILSIPKNYNCCRFTSDI